MKLKLNRLSFSSKLASFEMDSFVITTSINMRLTSLLQKKLYSKRFFLFFSFVFYSLGGPAMKCRERNSILILIKLNRSFPVVIC